MKLGGKEENGEKVNSVDQRGELGADSQLGPDAGSVQEFFDGFIPGAMVGDRVM